LIDVFAVTVGTSEKSNVDCAEDTLPSVKFKWLHGIKAKKAPCHPTGSAKCKRGRTKRWSNIKIKVKRKKRKRKEESHCENQQKNQSANPEVRT
jgi:hypothetical protein